MKTILKPFGVVLVGVLVLVVGLYAAGYRITIQDRSSQPAIQGGTGKGSPGWRRSQGGEAVAPQPGSGQGQGGRGAALGGGHRGGAPANSVDPGAGEGPRSNVGSGPGSGQGQGRRSAAAGQGSGGGGRGQAQAAKQPGFGPSGGILLPIKAGTEQIPVMLNGKQAGSFVGKDLIDHVEDTVIATAEGPRKGWGVGKTLAYLGIKEVKEVALFDKSGKKVVVSAEQIKDDKTFVLLTYNDQGNLLLASGPKVRGTNKGTTTREQVLQMVQGRKDLLAVPMVVRIEVKS